MVLKKSSHQHDGIGGIGIETWLRADITNRDKVKEYIQKLIVRKNFGIEFKGELDFLNLD